LFGCSYGCVFDQERDIVKCEGAKKLFGIKHWRTHEYESNSNTRVLLMKYGYESISDSFILPNDDFSFLPRRKVVSDLDEISIIVPEDHSCVRHELFEDVRDGLLSAHEFINVIESATKKNCHGVFQLHPLCMKFIDDFKMFRKICKIIS